ncbi:MAG: bifunctional UDP-N-acetylglucosamine diphosphorylase/glucosamine-1-phosphate N-acetyltransferase GlmU [Parvularculales bacterium]
MERTVTFIVLAGGRASRMKTNTPKSMHAVAGKPMLGCILDMASAITTNSVKGGVPDVRSVVVMDPNAQPVIDYVQRDYPEAAVVYQKEPRGTGEAIACALPVLADQITDDVLIVFGDTPLIREQAIMSLIEARDKGAHVAVLGFDPEEPSAYGRLVTDGSGQLVRIVEARDANKEEQAITLCNGGAMAVSGEHLASLIKRLSNDNAQGEYYLTEIVSLAHQDGLSCRVVEAHEEDALGVNDRAGLAKVEAIMQNRLRARALAAGVTLEAPESVKLCCDTVLEADVIIEPHVVFGPGVRVGAGVHIRSFSHIEGAVIEAGAQIGPFARVRPGSHVASGAKLGNFVEVKNAQIETGAKISHLSYVGDARVGANANIGAGVITCNYDGVNKHHTDIGEGAFIGSNSALVAPVSIGKDAYIASGSTITNNVDEDDLAIARTRQSNKKGLAGRYKKTPESKK